MLNTIFSKTMWVGRATVFMVGLAVILALMFGVASTALSATGSNLILGRGNSATTVSKLTSSVAGPTLQLINKGTDAAATALNVNVSSGQAPLTVNPEAGTATNLSADELDGRDSGSFANATHAHAGEDITSGTVASARIDGSIARDDEVVPTVKANDGSGSGVDADTIDGMNSSSFFRGQTYVVRETASGTTRGAAIILKMKCQSGDKVLSGGLVPPFGGTLLTSAPGKINSWGGVDYVQTGDSPDAWIIDWVPNFDSGSSTFGYAVCADLG
jgi:hypothetical protein